MLNLISALIIATITISPTNTNIENNKEDETVTEISQEKTEEIVYEDPNCRTPYMPPDQVANIINETKTKDLNFVALAKAESGLNNTSYHLNYRGIFQVHEGYHKLDDYCDPAEQVVWLERKLDEGADPARLFPSTHHKLYV